MTRGKVGRCWICRKPEWWHFQGIHIRLDDGHAFISESANKKAQKKIKSKARKAEKEFLELTKDLR